LLTLLPAAAALGGGSSCSIGNRNANDVGASGRFQPFGTILALVVGDGTAPLAPGVAAPLFVVEIQTADGAELQRIQLPTRGAALGSNLACTLATGMFASNTWNWLDNDEHFDSDHCSNATAFFGAVPPSQGGPACDAAGAAAPSAHYAADWNKDGTGFGHGDGQFPLWYWDREGLMAPSFDGRFVTFPCYVTTPGAKLKKGSWYDGGGAPSPSGDPSTYDDKTVAVLDFSGRVDTITHLPGTDFFYGPLVPSEAQYFTSAIMTGEYYPASPLFVGGGANNGEGTMYIPYEALTPTKGVNRISNTPGYFDYGQLNFGASGGDGTEPLIYASSPSVLSAGLEGGGTQHQYLRGLSVMTVGGKPGLSTGGGVDFAHLPGFDAYAGAPFGFVFENAQSLWIADSGPNATGGPATCKLLGGAPCPTSFPIGQGWARGGNPGGQWDKYSCTIQHWVSPAGSDPTVGPWSYDRSIVVANDAPCFSLAGHYEGGDKIDGRWYLYTTTPSDGIQPNSRLWRIDAASGTAEVLADALDYSQFRSVALPPQPRANYTCPAGQFGISCDLACAYDCCANCSTNCPEGYQLLNTCSTQWDNLCVPASASPQPSASSSSTATATATGTSTSTSTSTGTSTRTLSASSTSTHTGSATTTPSAQPQAAAAPGAAPQPFMSEGAGIAAIAVPLVVLAGGAAYFFCSRGGRGSGAAAGGGSSSSAAGIANAAFLVGGGSGSARVLSGAGVGSDAAAAAAQRLAAASTEPKRAGERVSLLRK